MNPAVKYTFIILCFSMCLIKNIRKLRLNSVRCLLAGLFFTVLADYFLVFTYNFIPGILLFCIVQFCYCRIFDYSLLFLAENGLLGATLCMDRQSYPAFSFGYHCASGIFFFSAWLQMSFWHGRDPARGSLLVSRSCFCVISMWDSQPFQPIFPSPLGRRWPCGVK